MSLHANNLKSKILTFPMLGDYWHVIQDLDEKTRECNDMLIQEKIGDQLKSMCLTAVLSLDWS
jgi:hypothetical protein